MNGICSSNWLRMFRHVEGRGVRAYARLSAQDADSSLRAFLYLKQLELKSPRTLGGTSQMLSFLSSQC